jgi:hypothetical protein
LSVEATPLVLRNHKSKLQERMQPRLLHDQTNLNQSVFSPSSLGKKETNESRSEAALLPSELEIENVHEQLTATHEESSLTDWVDNMRQAVLVWMERQRQVIDCERIQTNQEVESYQHALVSLQERYQDLQEVHSKTDHKYEQMREQFGHIIDYQQSRIEVLEKQLKMSQQAPNARKLAPLVTTMHAEDTEDATPRTSPTVRTNWL